MPANPFGHRHALRRWAARLLMLWLFGVGTALANACFVSEPPAVAQLLADSAAETAKSHCKACCERSATSVAPLKSALGGKPGLGLAPLLVASAWQMPALPAPSLAVPHRAGAQAPPVAIAILFLRLAL